VHTKSTGGKPILVVIDVLAMAGKPVGDRQLYEADYGALADLAKLANELGFAIVVLHHTRKMAADDLMETVSGPYGISGAVDTVLVMANKPNGPVLDVRGRDVESAELAIEFEKKTCRWRLLGDAAEVHVSSQRAKVIAALKEAGSVMTIPALIEATGMKRNALDVLLGRMAKEARSSGWARDCMLTKLTPHPDLPAPDPPSKNKPKSAVRPPNCRLCPGIGGRRGRDRSAVSASTGNNRTKPSICPSVQSVRENADRNGARASVPAQTDRTDRQTGALVTEQSTELAAADLSRDLAREDPDGQIGSGRGPQDEFPELPASPRGVPVAPGAPPGDSPDGAEGIEEEEEEEGVWTL
jgi:hypothetical protein